MVSLSALDTERFGIVTARCPLVTATELEAALAFCRERRVDLLIARCDAADYAAVHAIESAGGRLMDTLVYYARDLSDELPPPRPSAAMVRAFRPNDAAAVRATAAQAFTGYLGHYHTDPRLNRAKADETYADWAHRSCLSKEVAEQVLVADLSGQIVGFLTLRLNGSQEAEVVLNGVAPAAQRGGVYGRLLDGAMAWSRSRGASRLVISTQVTNFAVQRAWTRAGFAPLRSYYTFHLWFDRH